MWEEGVHVMCVVSVWMCVNEYTLYTLHIRFVNRECAHTHTTHPYLIRAASDKNFLCSSIVEPFLRVCRNIVFATLDYCQCRYMNTDNNYSTTSMHKSLLTARVLPYLHSNGCRPGVWPKNVNGCSLIHLTKLSPVYEPVQ